MPVKSEPERRPNLVLTVVGVGTFLTALAGSAVFMAQPNLGRELGVSIGQIRWITQGFLLSVAVLLLPVGRLSDILGHHRIYLAGFLLFGLMSLLCGLAESFSVLVGARLVQGIGGAMIMATGPALLTTSFPGAKRGKALGILAALTYAGLTLGPPLGGLVVASLGWRWTFFINIPVALVVLLLGFKCLPGRLQREKKAFDWGGMAALCLALPLLLLALSEGRHWGLASWKTWLSALLGLSGMGVFIFLQRRGSSPLLDLKLFHSRIFTGATLSAMANYIAIFVMMFLMPFYLQEGLLRTPDIAGRLLMVQPLVMALVAMPSGWLSDRLGSRGLATVGMLLLTIGLVSLSFLSQSSGDGTIISGLSLVGLGVGIFISPNSSALMGSAPPNRQGTAGSILAEARVLGMLIGVAMTTAVFQAAGGHTGSAWRPVDFNAYRVVLWVAAGVALLGALASSLRGARQQDATNAAEKLR